MDASVAIKWLFRWNDEEDDVRAALLLLQGVREGHLVMVQPPHFVAEVASVVAREAGASAKSLLADVLDLKMQIEASAETYRRAVALSQRLSHHLFDTLYHAVALETPGAVLVTADERYHRAARGEGCIVRLSEFQAGR